MKRTNEMPRLLGLVLLVAGTSVLAQGKADLGKREYDSNCASCHGVDGKGTGAYVDFLKRTPTDLTMLTKRNGGVYPISRVYEVIDGGGVGHGTRDMPVWGQDYRVKAGEYYVDVPYDSEVFVRTRILGLTEYLSRLQAK
ncbi:MAG: c-type cytochrome [Rubrivivax sp.]